MKDLSLLVWVTQLGLSVALPPIAFILLAKWLQGRFGWGSWAMVAAVILGILCAVEGLIYNLKVLMRLSKEKKQADSPPVSFNDHD